MTEKKKSWSTSWIVFIYALVVALIMALQAAVIIFGKLVEVEIIKLSTTTLDCISKLINGEMTLPIGSLSTLWIVVVSAYIGMDRAQAFFHSQKLEYLEEDRGDPKKLRKAILVSGLLFLEGVALTTVTEFDYSLTQFSTAFGCSCALYIAGQKAISAAKYVNGEFHTYTKDGKIDDNANGIPDEEEEALNKFEKRVNRATSDTSSSQDKTEAISKVVKTVL